MEAEERIYIQFAVPNCRQQDVFNSWPTNGKKLTSHGRLHQSPHVRRMKAPTLDAFAEEKALGTRATVILWENAEALQYISSKTAPGLNAARQ